MQEYPAYKDSGILWFNYVPSHWNVTKNKYFLIEQKTLVDENWKIFSLLSLTKRGVILRDVESGKGKFPTSFETYKKIDSEDLVFCLFDIQETPRTVGISMFNGMVTGAYDVFKCKEYVLPKYIYYYYLTIDDFKGLKPYYTGLRNVVRTDVFGSLKIYLPPLLEQHQIVAYLDQKTTLIDELIKKKERKIELLREKRTALINHSVTKGLNPDIEMKDSGVEWIGKIPEHWKVPFLRYITSKVGSGSTPRGGSEIYPENGIYFIRSQNVHFDGLHLNDVVYITPEIHSSMKGTQVKHGDILLNITGGSIGRCCVVELREEINVNQHVSILRTNQYILNYFMNYVLSANMGQEQVAYNQTGGNREGLTADNIKNFRIPIPPEREQQQITDYLNKQTQIIDSTIEKEQQKIELLKEYRQALISEVVTGKINVCD